MVVRPSPKFQPPLLGWGLLAIYTSQKTSVSEVSNVTMEKLQIFVKCDRLDLFNNHQSRYLVLHSFMAVINKLWSKTKLVNLPYQ